MGKIIGRIAAIEKIPTTIDEFYFWTNKNMILNPFDVIKVDHIKDSFTYGVIEEISHITDAASYLSSFVSNDFGDVTQTFNTHRIGMNFVKARVIANTKNIYNPVLDGSSVSLADKEGIEHALGLLDVKNPLPCGYLEMYEGDDKVKILVNFNSHFIIGPEGAHLNISGISGLASKTSYAMFLLKAIQSQYLNEDSKQNDESIAYVILNVKGRDLLSIDEPNENLTEEDKNIYNIIGLDTEPFKNVKYLYPNFKDKYANTVADPEDIKTQMDLKKAFKYKYIYEEDKNKLDFLFANIDDSSGTMEAIVNYIITEQGNFNGIRNWEQFFKEIDEHTKKQSTVQDKEIAIASWRKFKRIVKKVYTSNRDLFGNSIAEDKFETRISQSINDIEPNDTIVVDIAKLDEDMQAFVFGDVIRSIYELKLGQIEEERTSQKDIPSKIIIFIDELNKYASTDVPKNSPILRNIIDITERGRSLGIILFSAEQFKSAIHDRVKGNCSTHAYGRTNAIEISKNDYKFIPPVYKSMMTRLKQGEYIIQNPVFSSLLNIKFPKPLFKQFKNG